MFFGMMAQFARNPLTFLIGIGEMIFFNGAYAIAGTALVVFIVLSGSPLRTCWRKADPF